MHIASIFIMVQIIAPTYILKLKKAFPIISNAQFNPKYGGSEKNDFFLYGSQKTSEYHDHQWKSKH